MEKLVRRFGVSDSDERIRACFDLVCGESLIAGAGRSSLNADGTPVQFALSLAAGRTTAFEFVGEAFTEGMDYEARRTFGLDRMALVAETLGVSPEFHAVQPRLEEFAGDGPAGDWEDPTGAFWIGASFDQEAGDAMTIYANARRGGEEGRWARLGKFAPADVDLTVTRAAGLKPLGAGFRVKTGHIPHSRVYLGSYGVKPDEYRRMFRESGAGVDFDHALEVFFEETLRGDRAYPTRSAVVSFGSDGGLAPKLELCAHCGWAIDTEATARCGTWLERIGIDAMLYRDAVGILAEDREQRGAPVVHAYIGVGMRRGKKYASIYLNPGPNL